MLKKGQSGEQLYYHQWNIDNYQWNIDNHQWNIDNLFYLLQSYKQFCHYYVSVSILAASLALMKDWKNMQLATSVFLKLFIYLVELMYIKALA